MRIKRIRLNPEYFISDSGDIYSTKKNKVLKPWVVPMGKGYKCIAINKKKKYIHRLVAEHFVDNSKGYSEVNHIDGNTRNNSYTNLEWVTHRQNMVHAYANGLIKHEHKLSEEQEKEIRFLVEHRKFKRIYLAEKYGVVPSVITRICTGLVDGRKINWRNKNG